MIHQLTSMAVIETVLMKLMIKQKKFIYQIARLDYRIFKSLAKLEVVNALIIEEEQNIKSLDAAIKAAGEGKIAEKLIVWKIKAEYKLFKLNLRKNKIDIAKLIFNQSKLEQLKQALIALETDIAHIETQKQSFAPAERESKIETNHESIFTFWEKAKRLKEQDPINQSVSAYLKEAFRMAS